MREYSVYLVIATSIFLFKDDFIKMLELLFSLIKGFLYSYSLFYLLDDAYSHLKNRAGAFVDRYSNIKTYVELYVSGAILYLCKNYASHMLLILTLLRCRPEVLNRRFVLKDGAGEYSKHDIDAGIKCYLTIYGKSISRGKMLNFVQYLTDEFDDDLILNIDDTALEAGVIDRIVVNFGDQSQDIGDSSFLFA